MGLHREDGNKEEEWVYIEKRANKAEERRGRIRKKSGST